MLGNKFQNIESPVGPREFAKLARDSLIKQVDLKSVTSAFLIPNLVFEIDPTTQQSPGVQVTPEEQHLADSGALEYTFQVELSLKNATDLATFQQFTNKVFEGDKDTRFLPWFNNDNSTLPDIDRSHNPYKAVRGDVRLKNYLGPYNRTKTRLYGRVKVRTV